MMTDRSQPTANYAEPGGYPDSSVQILGEFPEDLAEAQEYLLLQFSPSSLSLKKQWCTNGLSADFLAEYLTTFFPGDKDSAESNIKQAEVQSAVSYIANELLENAMKFNDHNSRQPISIQLQLYPNKLVFLVTNGVVPATMQKYQSYIQEIIASDPSEMLVRRIEQNAQDQHLKSSRLGLVTIMNDYSAQLGWKFETTAKYPEIVTVTTMVQLTI